jgi:NAD(P) transhydrogenase subunit alpha
MTIGVPRETRSGERRVALVPASLPALIKASHSVLVEAGAGLAAGFPDDLYTQRGARVAPREEVFRSADLIAQVLAYGANPEAGASDLRLLRPGQAVVGFLDPLSAPDRAAELAATGVTSFAMELMPRITRAQSMDALSSMATIAGYKAVLLAATHLPKMFPLLMTAAGTVAAARVFVVGAGVAGLQAIATAKRLGAAVQAYDVRPAVKEQVESVGGKFVELPVEAREAETKGGYAAAQDESFYRRQRELMTSVVAHSDVVITTAAVPGRRAPVLVTRDMVEAMAPGSVVVDLAAERGGNCDVTRPDEVVIHQGVTILGPLNVPATVPLHASQMYSSNVTAFLLHLVKDNQLRLDEDDPIVRETLVTRGGSLVHPQIQELAAKAVKDS